MEKVKRGGIPGVSEDVKAYANYLVGDEPFSGMKIEVSSLSFQPSTDFLCRLIMITLTHPNACAPHLYSASIKVPFGCIVTISFEQEKPQRFLRC